MVNADAVYRLDYDAVVASHADSGADVTMVTTRRPIDEASRYGVVEVDGDRVTVRGAVVDTRARIGPDARVGADPADPALVGMGARVATGAVVPAGGRVDSSE